MGKTSIYRKWRHGEHTAARDGMHARKDGAMRLASMPASGPMKARPEPLRSCIRSSAGTRKPAAFLLTKMIRGGQHPERDRPRHAAFFQELQGWVQPLLRA
ncbi:MAG TPA: hypothetical protein DDZ22_05465 [Massilia sp.]|nr:hypothetical protein [Massilia sp.]